MLCLKIYTWDRSVFSENDKQLPDDDNEFDLEELEELEELEARIHKTAIDDT
jgi:hypothetical protein